MDFIKEFFEFLKINKKLWLAPLLLVVVLLGVLLFFAHGSVLAPFIYTIF